MKRSDIHRPSFANTADYQVLAVGFVDIDENPETGNEFKYLILEEYSPRWGELGQPEVSTATGHRESQCDHCGAHIKYYSIVEHKQTGEILQIGLACTGKFLGGDWTLEKAKLKAKATAERVLRSLLQAQRDAVIWADGDSQAWERVRIDAKSVLKGFEIDDWRWARLIKCHAEHLAKHVRQLTGSVNTVPTGRGEVSGLIVSIKNEENPYYRKWDSLSKQYIAKVLVQDDRGFKIYGTLPAAAKDAQKGDRISFTADLEPSQKDPEFGIFSRPLKCTLGKSEVAA